MRLETSVGQPGSGRSWLRRRTELNHDELNNRFIVALDGQAEYLAGRSVDPMKISTFLKEQLPRWLVLRIELAELLDDFERQMSPSALFDCPPLARTQAGDHRWLATLTHELWRARSSSTTLIGQAREALAAADVLYAVLQERIGTLEDCSFERFKLLRPDIENLAAACRGVATAIHQFPREVRAA